MARIQEIAPTRYGYWRLYTLLRREGWTVNHKRGHRLYYAEGSTCAANIRTAGAPPRAA